MRARKGRVTMATEIAMAFTSFAISILAAFLGWLLIGACLVALFWLGSARPPLATLRQLFLGPPVPQGRPMPLRDFLDAAQLRGFVFRGRPDDYRSFMTRLRQAALSGEIRFWGRASSAPLESFDAPSGLLPIMPAQWADHEFDVVMALYGATNTETRLECQADIHELARATFFDLHLDRLQAMHWLRKELAADAAVKTHGITVTPVAQQAA